MTPTLDPKVADREAIDTLLGLLQYMRETTPARDADTRKLRSEWRRAEAWLKDQEAAL